MNSTTSQEGNLKWIILIITSTIIIAFITLAQAFASPVFTDANASNNAFASKADKSYNNSLSVRCRSSKR